jgi:hypothetical protein
VNQNISIVDFVTDPQLLGLSISKPQETLLRSIYGLAITKSMLDIWRLLDPERIAELQRRLLLLKLGWVIMRITSPKVKELSSHCVVGQWPRFFEAGIHDRGRGTPYQNIRRLGQSDF